MSTEVFDGYAEQYDNHFTYSDIGRMQRARVHKYFSEFLSSYKNILEVNCGTGEDAIWLAQRGHRVLATDISARMITVAEDKKKKTSGLDLEFLQLPLSKVSDLRDRKFELVFSNFGGVNCLAPEELHSQSALISNVLNKDGVLFLVAMGRKCKWERFYFNRKGDPANANRRCSQQGVETFIAGGKMMTWYYSPLELSAIFSNHFQTISVRPVGLFVPPSYLNDYFAKKKAILHALNLAENIFGSISSFSDYADHYAIALKKRRD